VCVPEQMRADTHVCGCAKACVSKCMYVRVRLHVCMRAASRLTINVGGCDYWDFLATGFGHQQAREHSSKGMNRALEICATCVQHAFLRVDCSKSWHVGGAVWLISVVAWLRRAYFVKWCMHF